MSEKRGPYEQLKEYYQTSERYRDDLATHDESFLEPFLQLIERRVSKGGRILDLGCGTGLSTCLLERRGYEAIGIDLSPLFLEVEKSRNPDVSLLTANALQLPFADEIFDAVVGFEFIEHVHDVPALLDEMIRVVKVRGHIIIHSPNLLSPYLPAYDLLRLMQGGKGRPVFAETIPQARDWFKQNMRLSIKKWFPPVLNFSIVHRIYQKSGSGETRTASTWLIQSIWPCICARMAARSINGPMR